MATTTPTLDKDREERLRWILVEFALGTESAKAFDVVEMRTLRDDLTALLAEVDALRPDAARYRFLRDNPLGLRALDGNAALPGRPDWFDERVDYARKEQ